MKKLLALPLLLMLVGLPAAAQEEKPKPEPEPTNREILDRIRKAIKLPQTAEEARDAGVPEEEVREVLSKSRERRLPAGETQVLLEQETRAVSEHGPIDNFGAFVQSKLDEGLRGRELAEAIHQEHAARGNGKGKFKDKDKGKDRGKDHIERITTPERGAAADTATGDKKPAPGRTPKRLQDETEEQLDAAQKKARKAKGPHPGKSKKKDKKEK